MSAAAPAASVRVTPFLMFEGRAEEAMVFYTSLFEDGEIVDLTRYGSGDPGPEGTVAQARIRFAGQEFRCTDSVVEHDFGFTPSISLYVACAREAELDRLYTALSEDGEVLMPLDAYPFAAKFGWLNDRFGVSWQLALEND